MSEINSLLLVMLSKLITDYECTLDKTVDIDLELGFPVCIKGGAKSLWFNPQDTQNVLVINQSLGDSSFLTQKDSEDIVIPITDVEEKEYNLVSMEDLFFCLAQEIADNV